ncbi:MAG TPA: hypothetical protein VMT79_21410 [Candidatus Binatia bacterium]|nr:hypothetical protein [Candidatus Binatia bacterium]
MIRQLLDIRVNGMRVGIYGADVCQLCARLGTFEGQIHAAAVHFGTLTDYVCERCRRGPDRPRRDMNEGRAWARAALERQPHRFCEVCRKPVDQIPANRRMRFWVCEACLAPLPEDAGRAISDLSHRRFLDKTRRGVNALRSFAITMARMRLDLEEA